MQFSIILIVLFFCSIFTFYSEFKKVKVKYHIPYVIIILIFPLS